MRYKIPIIEWLIKPARSSLEIESIKPENYASRE